MAGAQAVLEFGTEVRAQDSARARVEASVEDALARMRAAPPDTRWAAGQAALATARLAGDVDAARAALAHLAADAAKRGDPLAARFIRAEQALLAGRLDDAYRDFASLQGSVARDPTARAELAGRLAWIAEARAAEAQSRGDPEAAAAAMKLALAHEATPARAQAALVAQERAHGGVAEAAERLRAARHALGVARQEELRVSASPNCSGGHRGPSTGADASTLRDQAGDRRMAMEAAVASAEARLQLARAEAGRILRAGVPDGAPPAARRHVELTLVDHLEAAGDVDGARRLLDRLVSATEAAPARVRVAVQVRRLAFAVAHGEARAEGLARGLRETVRAALRVGPEASVGRFLLRQAERLDAEVRLMGAATPADRQHVAADLERAVGQAGKPRSQAERAVLEGMRFRAAQLRAEDPAARAGAVADLVALAGATDRAVAAQALLQAGLLEIESGDPVSGLRRLSTLQVRFPASAAAGAVGSMPSLAEARDDAGRIRLRADAADVGEAVAAAFVASGQGPAWRAVALGTLGFVVGGPVGAGAGLALDRAISVGEGWDRVQGAWQTGLSGVSRAALAREALFTAADVVTLAAAGAVGRVARSAGRWGVARLSAEAARGLPRLSGGGLVARAAVAAGGLAAEGAAAHGVMAASQAVLTGREFRFDPVAALQLSLVMGASRLAHAGALGQRIGPATGRVAQVEPWMKETLLGFGVDYASRAGLAVAGVEGWAPGSLRQHAEAELDGMAALFLGGALGARFGAPARAAAALDRHAARWLRVAESRLPPPGAGLGPAYATGAGAPAARVARLFGPPRAPAEHVLLAERGPEELVWEGGAHPMPAAESGAGPVELLSAEPPSRASLAKLADIVRASGRRIVVHDLANDRAMSLERTPEGQVVTDSPALKAALGDAVTLRSVASGTVQAALRAAQGADLVEIHATEAPSPSEVRAAVLAAGGAAVVWRVGGRRVAEVTPSQKGPKVELFDAKPAEVAGHAEALLWSGAKFRLVGAHGVVASPASRTKLATNRSAAVAPLLAVVATHRAASALGATGADHATARKLRRLFDAALDEGRRSRDEGAERWRATEPGRWLEAAGRIAGLAKDPAAAKAFEGLMEVVATRSDLPGGLGRAQLDRRAESKNALAVVEMAWAGGARAVRFVGDTVRHVMDGPLEVRGAFVDVVWAAELARRAYPPLPSGRRSSQHESFVLEYLAHRREFGPGVVYAIPSDRSHGSAGTRTPDFLVQTKDAAGDVVVSTWVDAKSWDGRYIRGREEELQKGIEQVTGHRLESTGRVRRLLAIDVYAADSSALDDLGTLVAAARARGAGSRNIAGGLEVWAWRSIAGEKVTPRHQPL